jgi:hypothetical protein
VGSVGYSFRSDSVNVQKHLTLAAVVGTLAIAGSLTSAYNLRQHPSEKQLRFASSIGMVALLAGATALIRKTEEEEETTVKPDVSVSSITSEPLLTVVEEQQKYPHLLLINKTGGGKSVLAQWIGARMKGRVFAVAPHYDRTKSSEWSTCNAVFGAGRNAGTPDDETLDYNKLIAGDYSSPTIASILKTLLFEMDKRYRSPLAFENHPLDTWIVDEAPVIAASLEKSFADLLAPVLMEARKVNIRLVLLTQTDRVASLGFKGKGQLRDQFTYVYLKDAATSTKALRELSKPAKRLPNDTRWVLVERTVAALPALEEMLEDMRANAKTDRFVANFPSEPLDFKAVVRRGNATVEELVQISEALASEPTLKAVTTRAKLLVNDGQWIKENTEVIRTIINNACTLKGLALCK